jgi:hypothetical protein
MYGVRKGRMGEIDSAVEDAHLDALPRTLFYQFQDLVPVQKLFKCHYLSPPAGNLGEPFEPSSPVRHFSEYYLKRGYKKVTIRSPHGHTAN